MPARKLRVELYDWEGNKFTVTFEGRVTREKVIRLLDFVELMGGVSESDLSWRDPSELTMFEKVKLLVERYFPLVWFKSTDVKFAYEQEFREPIKLSTVSTYLARLVERGFLVRRGPPNDRQYRIATELVRQIIGQPST